MTATKSRLRQHLYDYLTLKRRIIFIFLVSTLIPFITIILISYFTIYSILTNKIQTGIQNNLRQVELSLESSINNLNHVSQQLAFGGIVGNRLDELLSAKKPFDRSKLLSDLKEELGLITFTNPSIGLTLYYFKDDHSYDLANFGVKDPFSPQALPLLAEYSKISYYGPHVSNNRFDNGFVLSAMRKVDLPHQEEVYIYIETGFKLTQNILHNDQIGGTTSHVFLDNHGRVAYSDAADFQVDTLFPHFDKKQMSGTQNGYYWFREVSNQGWSIISLTAKSDYNKEMNRWFVQIGLFSLLFLGMSLFLAWLLWKMVYRPLNGFSKEIKRMAQNKVQTTAIETNIPEFDFLVAQFKQMKTQIWELFAEVELKEKRRADLEVEKLLYQINPHFLMNTLDTVHWLAVMNGQDEIDRLVLSLNKLLHYNLGKLGQTSTIQEEIEAVQQYLLLQQIRYDFMFDVHIHVDAEVLRVPVPRFILQPLVENSLYHGLDDEGYIEVDVRLTDKIDIYIRDNGAGMSAEKIHSLLHSPESAGGKVGMGIGMNYVNRMIENYYSGQAMLSVTSVKGEGTTIRLSLPFGGGNQHD
ncbi:histidine kinase [Paenibacillus albidus]|uniref:histidine kinase n=1 Tax=Paenibacillus albidus TaxID=2041023 RepID=A0A917C9B1_9BACL|nr:histidine kinase [Paenibacillus albidus]GGF79353.1 histidine kinase [Paenibacillus albidus]